MNGGNLVETEAGIGEHDGLSRRDVLGLHGKYVPDAGAKLAG